MSAVSRSRQEPLHLLDGLRHLSRDGGSDRGREGAVLGRVGQVVERLRPHIDAGLDDDDPVDVLLRL